MDTHTWIVIGWIVSGFVGALCGAAKGSTIWGLIFGLLLGPLGWILLLLKEPDAPNGAYAGTLGLVAVFVVVLGFDSFKESMRVQNRLRELREKLAHAGAPADPGDSSSATSPSSAR